MPSKKPPEEPEYVEYWARELVKAAGKRDARRILEDYRAIARNPRVSKRDRDIAKQRVKILAKIL